MQPISIHWIASELAVLINVFEPQKSHRSDPVIFSPAQSISEYWWTYSIDGNGALLRVGSTDFSSFLHPKMS